MEDDYNEVRERVLEDVEDLRDAMHAVIRMEPEYSDVGAELYEVQELRDAMGAVIQLELSLPDLDDLNARIAAMRTIIELTEQMPTPAVMTKVWIGATQTSYGNEYGLVAVVAETREAAIAKATRELSQNHTYVPHQKYAAALLANLDNMREVTEGVVVDWASA
jgi:vacuolar-type H+-ATPase catalytic subunit A/Vma1